MITTLTGPNAHPRKQELARLIMAFSAEHGDMAVERFDGEETTADRMHESIQSLPFLTARKLVVLREPGKQKAFQENIAEILEAVADTTDLVIYEPKLDKRGTYYKKLKKSTDLKEYAELDAQGLSAWIVSYVKEQGGVISTADSRFLIDRMGVAQQLVKSELDKLLVYDSRITHDTIELLTEPTPQSTVFELIDAAFSGRSDQALALYREQRALKVEPQAIIGMLAWQLHIAAVIKAAGQRNADEIAKAASLHPFVVRKNQGAIRHLTLADVRQHLAKLLEVDTQLKRTSVDADEALQLYLLQLMKN